MVTVVSCSGRTDLASNLQDGLPKTDEAARRVVNMGPNIVSSEIVPSGLYV